MRVCTVLHFQGFSIFLSDKFSCLYLCPQLEHRVEKAQEEFERISTNIRKEVERFELQRYHDFKATIISYLESVLTNQQQVCSLYLQLTQLACFLLFCHVAMLISSPRLGVYYFLSSTPSVHLLTPRLLGVYYFLSLTLSLRPSVC